ncbi:hypothetical protein [Clostridium akagii]|uniref:hypothetical protein n=1 Tax=Clostridium akagii TaxID=91623 RepID=UPI00047A7DF7|nr:hypothetical protein [Clostridium akagii]
MLFNTLDIFEIGKDDKILKVNYKKKKFIFKNTVQEKNISDSYMQNKKLTKKILIMCGQEIYIKKINVPNLNGNALEKVIKDELKFYYRVTEEIVFSYHVLRKNKNNLELLVFYINSERLEKLDIKTLYNVKAVYMVQFLYIEYVNRIIDNGNYILAFNHDNYFYLIYCEDKILKADDVQIYFKESEIQFQKHIFNFCRINNISINSVENLILAGLNNYGSFDIKCGVKNLGYLEKSKIYKF